MPIILENHKHKRGIQIKPNESKMLSIRYRFKIVNTMLGIVNEVSYYGTPWEVVNDIMNELIKLGYKIEDFEQKY